MSINKENFLCRRTLISVAVLALCAQAYAQDSVEELTAPESTVTIGVGAIEGTGRNASLAGQYNGLRNERGVVTLDIDSTKRDDATGVIMVIQGRDLGLESRELSFSREKQGDWRYSLDYSELVRRDPRTINTGMTGLGTTTNNIVRLGGDTLGSAAAPGTGADQDFKIKRVGLGLSGEKWINSKLQLELSFRNEEKTGDRAISRGYACAAYVCTTTQNANSQAWAILLLDEPINSVTKQFEAKLNYAGQGFNLSAGYYGSFYTNANGSLSAVLPASGRLNNPLGNLSTLNPAALAAVIAGGGTSLKDVMQLPMALAPDNEAHQFYLSGNAKLSASTQATFKYSYIHATQTEDFASMGLANAPAGVTNLGGVVDTNLYQIGITSRPIPKLTLLANVRYEDKNDHTPEALYNVEGGTNPAAPPANVNRSWFNYRASSTKLNGKLEASYQLPADIRGTVGLDFSSHDRPVPVSITEEELAGLGAVRAKNDETGYRLELRRSMSESFTGSVAYLNSKRTGSDWTSLSTSAAFALAGLGYGQTAPASKFIALNATNAFPMNMADIDREKVKLSANWTPSDELEVQFYAENGTDRNVTAASAIAGGKGWRENGSVLYSVDAKYAISENWKLTSYASQGTQTIKVNHSTGYMADIRSNSDAYGLGIVGSPAAKWEIGADLVYLNDTTKYGLTASRSAIGAAASATNTSQAAIGLPDVVYQTASLSLHAKYAIDKKSSVKIVVVSQQTKLNEWSYSNNGVPYLYSDSTTVSLKQDQLTNFLGMAYVMKF